MRTLRGLCPVPCEQGREDQEGLRAYLDGFSLELVEFTQPFSPLNVEVVVLGFIESGITRIVLNLA